MEHEALAMAHAALAKEYEALAGAYDNLLKDTKPDTKPAAAAKPAPPAAATQAKAERVAPPPKPHDEEATHRITSAEGPGSPGGAAKPGRAQGSDAGTSLGRPEAKRAEPAKPAARDPPGA
jgi:hypothetical protein